MSVMLWPAPKLHTRFHDVSGSPRLFTFTFAVKPPCRDPAADGGLGGHRIHDR
jgi:hypothetical protein